MSTSMNVNQFCNCQSYGHIQTFYNGEICKNVKCLSLTSLDVRQSTPVFCIVIETSTLKAEYFFSEKRVGLLFSRNSFFP